MADDKRIRVLVVDDDEDVRVLIATALEHAGILALPLGATSPLLERLDELEADLLILDIEMGHVNGLTLLEELRTRSGLPVLLLTGLANESDRVRGLDLGADDYVVKPFLLRELVSRVRAILRRSQPAQSYGDVLRFGELRIDTAGRMAKVGERDVQLTRLEYALLAKLASVPGEVFARERLLQEVWESDSEWQDPETVTEHMRRLRIKLEAAGYSAAKLVTVRGVGYRFEP